MEKWIIKQENINLIENQEINNCVLNILANRGIDSDKKLNDFINPSLNNLTTPLLLPDIIKASNLIINSINENKKIRIVGDYDVDGVMSTYILTKALLKLGAIVDYQIPNRVMDGYGINSSIIDKAKEDGISLIITCDNGIAQHKEIIYANSLGINVIITDHHEIPKNDNGEDYIPEAYAVIDPKRSNSKYPFKDICGAVVAFKVIQYLFKIKGFEDEYVLDNFLQFACIATICDVMPLIDENRIIVKYGLEYLNESNNTGIRSIIKASGIEGKILDVYHIGFIIGPTINSSGRLESADIALKLLFEDNEEDALKKATYLRELNAKRQNMTEEGFNKVDEIIIKYNMDKKFPVFVLREYSIDESIVGIIAGKIKEKYNHPTIILTKTKTELKGSGRSIDGYNMFEKISCHKDLLSKFGGHEMACGLSLDEDNFKKFVIDINNNSNITKNDLIKKVYIDQEIQLSNITYELIEDLEKLKPYGTANPKVSFCTKNLKINSLRIFGKNKNVLKLKLYDGSVEVEGLLFENSDLFFEKLSSKYSKNELENMMNFKDSNVFIDIIFTPEINNFMDNSNIELKISNYRVSEGIKC